LTSNGTLQQAMRVDANAPDMEQQSTAGQTRCRRPCRGSQLFWSIPFLLMCLSAEFAFSDSLPPPTNVAVACTSLGSCDIALNNGMTASVSDASRVTFVRAQAIATYGSLGVESFSSFIGFGTPAYSFGIAYVRDNITISAPLLNGSAGLLSIDYLLDGTINAAGMTGSAVVQVAILVEDSMTLVTQSTNTAYTSSISGSFRAPQSFEFTYGEPFRLDLCLGAATGRGIIPAIEPGSGHLTTFLCAPGRISGSGGGGTGTADFFNSLTLSGLTVTDSFGTPANGAQFTSESGTQYGPSGVVQAPEPGSLLQLASGLVMMLAMIGRARLPGVVTAR